MYSLKRLIGSAPALRGLDGGICDVKFETLIADCAGGCKIIGLLSPRFPRPPKPPRLNPPIFAGYIRFPRPKGKLVRSSGFCMYPAGVEGV